MNEESKNLAPESEKTKKTREKLQKHFKTIDANITPQALKRKSLEIHRWIAKYASHRIVLRSKSISLFDENQHSVKLSQRISQIAERLKD
jgi:hypothetical protein